MAYKGKSFVAASASHLVSELKDFLVTCGWVLEGPSAGTGPADNDDAESLILGHFLKSTGEDTAQDLHIHLGVAQENRDVEFAPFDYLTESGGISDTDTDFDVEDGSVFEAGGKYRIEDEIFVVGTVSVNRLVNCQRGWGITDAATHAQYKVIQAVEDSNTNALLYSEIFAFSDLTTALLTSAAVSTGWTKIAADFSGDTVLDDGGYWGDDRFNHHNLIENVTDGKMRWVTDYDSASAVFSHQKFLVAPTSAAVGKVYSAGFLPGWSRRGTSGSYGKRHLGIWGPFTETGSPWSQTFHAEAGTVVWMYGSKDGLFLVGKWPTIGYQAFYIGNAIPFSSPLTTTLSSGATTGDNVLNVNNTDIFTEGQKVRVMSQSVADWLTNEDRSAETPAGNWPNLDPEEIPSEEVHVLSVGVGTITLSSNIKYDYSTGAVIGEDPRPAVRLGNEEGADAARAQFAPLALSVIAAYTCVKKDAIAQHASHRQTSRASHQSGQPYNPCWMDGQNVSPYSRVCHLEIQEGLLAPATQYVMQDNDSLGYGNYQNDQLLMQRMTLELDNSTPITEQVNGIFNAGKGVIPFCWTNTYEGPPYGGTSEDTVEGAWAGSYETFRYFLVNGIDLIVGPEIA